MPTSEFIDTVQDEDKRRFLRSCYETTVSEGFTVGEICRDKSRDMRGRDKPDGKDKYAGLTVNELPGYLPLREDFDVEFDNDAEEILADLEFTDDDHPAERELKHEIIRIFNLKLDERNLRKRFAIDRGLVDIKKHQLVKESFSSKPIPKYRIRVMCRRTESVPKKSVIWCLD